MLGTKTILAKSEPKISESYLIEKSKWVRAETLRIHQRAPETRVASSLSPIEIFVALYYGGILNFNAKAPFWEGRDRFVISKGHGSISMYPILADLNFFERQELDRVCQEGSFLGGIPDPIIPGYETVNGSLGHGLGVACGMALGLRVAGKPNKVFCMVGDGELNEGSIWEALMFAGHHKLDNLVVIVDCNQKCMLNYTANVMDLQPLIPKFNAFGFHSESVDGHDVNATASALLKLKNLETKSPKVLIANTVKGKGAPQLEKNPMCHIIGLKSQEIEEILRSLENDK